jgi:hypothetical protein
MFIPGNEKIVVPCKQVGPELRGTPVISDTSRNRLQSCRPTFMCGRRLRRLKYIKEEINHIVRNVFFKQLKVRDLIQY